MTSEVLHTQARSIVAAVIQYFYEEEENKGPLKDVRKVLERVADCTKVPKRTVERINAQLREINKRSEVEAEGFTEGQNGGIDPKCNTIAAKVLQQKQPLLAQLKKFAADDKFQYIWGDYVSDGFCMYVPCMNANNVISYNLESKFRSLVKAFELKAEILNATLNVTRIISSQELKLKQFQARKFKILKQYYKTYSIMNNTFDLFYLGFVNKYYNFANASSCAPCTDANKFSSCLNTELNKIKESLAIFKEVAGYYNKKSPRVISDTIDLLTKQVSNFPLTNDQIFDFFKNTYLKSENDKYISDLESRYGFYLKYMIRDSVKEFTKIVQNNLESASIENTCVENVLKDVTTQIKPYLTPIAKTLPAWNFEEIVSSYVKPKNLTDINLIERFTAGFADYRNSIFPPYVEFEDDNPYYYNMNNPYTNHINSIIKKGFTDLKQCPDFGLVYGNTNFRLFVDKGSKGAFDQSFLMGFQPYYDY